MAVDKLINETQGNDIIDRLDDIASNLGNVAAIIPAKFGMGLATCDTAADTAAKTCTIPNFALTNGAPVSVKFTYSNSASNATLNINGTGAKPMYYKGNPLGSGVISAGDIATFVYSSTGVYHIINIDTLTGAGTGTVTQIGGTGGITTNQTSGAPIQHDGNVKLNLKSDTAYTGTVADPSTDASIANGNVYPVALDGSGHPCVGVPWSDTTYSDFVGSGSSSAHGLVPDPGSTAGTTRYLREDGSWAVPPGSGGTGNSILLNGNTVHPEARDITSEVWESKSWSGMTSYDGWYVWSNGTDIFYSNGNTQKVLNKSTNTWSDITWNVTIEQGFNVWSDGENIYYSGGINGGQYVFDKTTNNWVTKTWTGSGNYIQGYCIWYDGDVFHYDYHGDHMVRNKSTGEWETKTWTGVDYLYGRYIWSDDGENFYYSTDSNQQYVLNKATSTWSAKTWTGLTYFNGYDIWSDGKNVYYSSGSDQYVLDKATSTWTNVTWTGLSSFNGERIWSDGDKLYYSNSSNQYILKRNTPTTVELLGCIGDVHSIIREVL